MKEYKVEALIYYSKLTFDSEHIVKKSKEEIQEKLDEYASLGYRLTSTTSTGFGAAVYIYLFLKKIGNGKQTTEMTVEQALNDFYNQHGYGDTFKTYPSAQAPRSGPVMQFPNCTDGTADP